MSFPSSILPSTVLYALVSIYFHSGNSFLSLFTQVTCPPIITMCFSTSASFISSRLMPSVSSSKVLFSSLYTKFLRAISSSRSDSYFEIRLSDCNCSFLSWRHCWTSALFSCSFSFSFLRRSAISFRYSSLHTSPVLTGAIFVITFCSPCFFFVCPCRTMFFASNKASSIMSSAKSSPVRYATCSSRTSAASVSASTKLYTAA